MLPNIIQVIVEFINSVLAPVPGFARGYVVFGALVAAFWVLGIFGDDDPDDPLDQIFQGISKTRFGLSQATEFAAPIVMSGVVLGGKALAGATISVGRSVRNSGNSLVEVEEAPIKIGPIVEIYGIRIGIIGILLGVFGLGGLFVFSGAVPVVP